MEARLVSEGQTKAANNYVSPDPVEDEDAPAGPSAAEEATLLSATDLRGAGGETLPAGIGLVAEAEDSGRTLPALDDLVQRIPSNVRAVMDDLFRAKFVRVQRVPKQALHP